MESIHFKETNCVYAKNQPQYLPLTVHKTPGGLVTSCWKFSFLERLQVMILGKVYLQVLTFNKPLQPVRLVVYKPKEILRNARK